MWWSSIASAGSTFMPPDGTAVAGEVNKLYEFLLVSSVISFILVVGGMCYFMIKYRRKSANDKTAYITHNHTLEFLWSFIPFVIFMVVFVWGWVVYNEMRKFPENSLEVHVVAKKWEWRFIYKNGKEVVNGLDSSNNKIPATMVVPVGRPVKLIMASEKVNPQDLIDRAVIHSFFVPGFRIKQDVVPGRYTTLGFTAEKEGLYNVFCAEYCGTNHSGMRGLVKVVSQEEFDQWLASDGASAGISLADKGKALFSQKACAGCHSLDGSRIVGPTFKALWGRNEALEGGTSVIVDENYVRESILQPNAKIVKGFPAGVMPTFAGQLTDDDIKSIIEFIKTIK